MVEYVIYRFTFISYRAKGKILLLVEPNHQSLANLKKKKKMLKSGNIEWKQSQLTVRLSG